MTLKDFYADRFNSDPYAILDAARDELADLAQSAGINWTASASRIQLNPRGAEEKFSRYAQGTPEALEPRLKGRVEIYSRCETSREGIRYPFVNFVRKGSDCGSWSGFQFLMSEYRYEMERRGTTVPRKTEAELARQKRQEDAQKIRLEQARVNELKTSQKRQQNLLGWMAFSDAFNSAPREDGSWPYAKAKGIGKVFDSCDVRRVTCHDNVTAGREPNTYMAIPLKHLDSRKDGRVVGWQRINKSGGKYQTSAVDAGDFIGACHVIGSLESPLDIAVSEGFATGASVWLATKDNPKHYFDAVVSAISANNMINVVEQLISLFPTAKITCLLDNDRKTETEGRGNTGLRTGFQIIEKFPQVNCVYPTFDDNLPIECNDFNDLHEWLGLSEVSRQIRSSKNKLKKSGDLLNLALRKLKTVQQSDRRRFAKELMRAVDLGLLTCPVPNSPQELFRTVCAALRSMGLEDIYKSSVKDHINRRFSRKCRAAQMPRSFSERITNPNLRPAHITYKRYESSILTEEILNDIQKRPGIHILRAGMGSGKTNAVLKPLMLASERGIAVAHRVSLMGGLYETMTAGMGEMGEKADILHYQTEGGEALAPYANKLIVCINSIVKSRWQPLMRQHDFFGFDEATQGLRAIISGRAMENPVGVFNTLIDALARTERFPIMVDADANDLLVDLAELAMARREELGLPAWLQIHVIELPVDVKNRDTGEPIRVFYTEKDRIVTEVLKAVEKGEKIMLATDSSTFAEDVTCQLKMNFPDKKFLCVNQKTKPEPEVEEFTNKPKIKVLDYDGLIYSPSISSGVSFEQHHFDRHFGMFCGEVVPSDAIQMLRRDRTAQEFVIGFDRMKAKRETDPLKIERAYAQALLETAGKNGELTDVIFENGRLSLGVANSNFMGLKIKAAALEASARNDYANNMICIMHSDGYKVARLATDEQLNDLGKELRKEARELMWDQVVERHMTIKTPTEAERDQLLNKRALTLEEQAQLDRWNIEHELKSQVNEQSLKFYFEGGMKKVRLFEMVKLDEISARRKDKEEALINFHFAFKIAGQWQNFITTGTTQEQAETAFKENHPGVENYRLKTAPTVEIGMRSFFTLKSEALQQYFNDCGIDPNTMEGEANQASLKQARDNLLQPARRDLLNSVLRIGGYQTEKGKPPAPEALFRNVCQSLGLAIDKRRARVDDKRPTLRFVKPESAKFMLDILDKRKEDGQELQVQKGFVAVQEVDRGLDLNIETNNRSRSTFEHDQNSPLSVIEQAIEGMPVLVPLSWVSELLTEDELSQLAAMPTHLIQATVAGLFISDHTAAPAPSLAAGPINVGTRVVSPPAWLKGHMRAV
jgi:putative DNA primase/helicase